MGISIEHNTNNTREDGQKCVRIWKRREMRILVQLQIRRDQNNNHVDRKAGETYEQGHTHNKNTVPKICIELAGKEERKQKGGCEYKTKHKPRSARNTGRKTGKEDFFLI